MSEWKMIYPTSHHGLFDVLIDQSKSIAFPATEKEVKLLNRKKSDFRKQQVIDTYKIQCDWDTSACCGLEFYQKVGE